MNHSKIRRRLSLTLKRARDHLAARATPILPVWDLGPRPALIPDRSSYRSAADHNLDLGPSGTRGQRNCQGAYHHAPRTVPRIHIESAEKADDSRSLGAL